MYLYIVTLTHVKTSDGPAQCATRVMRVTSDKNAAEAELMALYDEFEQDDHYRVRSTNVGRRTRFSAEAKTETIFARVVSARTSIEIGA